MGPNHENIRDHHSSLVFISKTPHFFKILLTDAIQHGKLKIPEKFVGKYGSGISSPVFLKVPSGTIWEVELTKSGSEIWLEKGWRQFVENYSLDIEDFVVFRYEGNSLFNVILFDRGASEIEYIHPQNRNLNQQSQGTQVKQENSDVEILDDMPPRTKTRGKSPITCPRPSKKPRINSNTKRTTGKSKFTSNVSPEHGHGSIQRTMRGKEKAKACQIASSFKSQNPFFSVVMQPSFLTDRYRMGIPLVFAREYLMGKHDRVHCVVDGKTWSVEYNTTCQSFIPRFCNGWKEFSLDNKLDVGDVCIFELVNVVEITFNVFIFRNGVAEPQDSPNSSVLLNSDDGNGAKVVKSIENLATNNAIKTEGVVISSIDDKLVAQDSQVHEENFNQVAHHKSGGSQSQYTRVTYSLDGVLEASSNSPPKDPYFEVVMRPCYLTHGALTVPAAFAKRYCTEGTKVITLEIAERRWPVKLKSYGGRCCLTSGWTRFIKENCLQTEDTCVFHLINTQDMVLRVSIIRHAA